MNKLIAHGHALYYVSDSLYYEICLAIAQVGKDKLYDAVVDLFSKYPNEFKYYRQIDIKI